MLVLEMRGIKKSYGERLILDLESFQLYEGEHVGIVGLNGAGKTTLLEILAGEVSPDAGSFRIHGSWAYIRQLETPEACSGGEQTLERINRAFSQDVHLLMADEPTSNLSLSHTAALQERLQRWRGGLLLISHDRELLNAVCDRIVAIENGTFREYAGNYDFYRSARAAEKRQDWERYESYARERNRIGAEADATRRKADKMTKAPKRMGNSEARLIKGAIREKAGRVGRTAAALEGRLQKLEAVEKPKKERRTAIDIPEGTRLYAKVAVEVKAAEVPGLFRDVSFQIANGTKTVLIGGNGVGKTTLVRMIVHGSPYVTKAAGLKIAYFAQDLSILDEDATLYANVARDSAMSQTEIRNVLARMLFRGEDVYKPVSVLSGGERVKAALCKIFCKDVNMLILDEPNNYLDVDGMEALDELIRDYGGTILFVSHDRSLIGTADHLLIIEKSGLQSWSGSFQEYTEKRTRPDERLRIENRLAALCGEIAERSRRGEDISELDREFARLSEEIRGMNP